MLIRHTRKELRKFWATWRWFWATWPSCDLTGHLKFKRVNLTFIDFIHKLEFFRFTHQLVSFRYKFIHWNLEPKKWQQNQGKHIVGKNIRFLYHRTTKHTISHTNYKHLRNKKLIYEWSQSTTSERNTEYLLFNLRIPPPRGEMWAVSLT